MRLLIADSDSTLTDIYESFFSGKGCEIEISEDGLQCLDATRRRVFDVLVLEHELPWGGGDGVLASLRDEFPFVPIGVVLITGDYSQEEFAHELTPPVTGCLLKPFRLRELSEMTRSITEDSPGQTGSGLLNEMTVHLRRVVQP